MSEPRLVDRRNLLRQGAVSAAGAAVGGLAAGCGGRQTAAGGSAAVVTKPAVSWRLASSFPPGLDTIFGVAEVFARRLEQLSDGRFTLRVHAAGELVPALQVMDAVQTGTVQIAQTAGYYFSGKHPALAFDTTLPFGLTSRQQMAWLLEGGGLELVRKVYAEFDIVSFPAGNTGAQMGGWFKREVRTVADLGGLRIRLPGLGGQVMDRLGASVQVLPGGDIFPALERGAIDAADWSGPYDDEKLGLHQAAKYYYYPGFWEPGPALSYLVGRQAWATLPSDYQAMFEVAAAESATLMQARYDARNPPALRRLLAGGTELRAFSPEILGAAARAANELIEEQAAADALYAEVYANWRAFREASFAWFGVAERAYADWAFPTPTA